MMNRSTVKQTSSNRNKSIGSNNLMSSNESNIDNDRWVENTNVDEKTKAFDQQHSHENETVWNFISQVSFPLLIAGFGMMFAGLLLDLFQDSVVFQNVSGIYILVPALLGLKGNLEMTMASRLSSIANMGKLNSFKQRSVIFKAHIALTQCQSIVVGFFAALLATFGNWLYSGQFRYSSLALLCATSIVTASLASLILGLIMMFVIVWSMDFNINPDNISTPIAAALGDLVTLYILYVISSGFYSLSTNYFWLSTVVVLLALLIAPFAAVQSNRHSSTKEALRDGWVPVLTAMHISSLGGFILNFSVKKYKNIAVYQPLINGVGGNLAAIQASRLSTYFHLISTNTKDGSAKIKHETSPFFSKSFNIITFLIRSDNHSKTARILLALVVPLHLIFLIAIYWFQTKTFDQITNIALFLFVYAGAAFMQVLILLYFTGTFINWMWHRATNPDNSLIPYLTAFGDLFGTLFLTIAFFLYEQYQFGTIYTNS